MEEVGTGKTTYIFNEISENINNGTKKYIITPEQFSFTAEKELLKSLKEKNNSSAVINADVLSFNRMAHRVASEVGGTAKTALSNSGKAMLIYSILANKKNDLKFLGKSNNNVELVLTQITELKQHGVSKQALEELMQTIEPDNKYLYAKLQDINTVYGQYEEKIKGKYIDENDSLSVLLWQLDSTNIFNNCEIYIDEFVGFTKQEYLIIEKLLKVASKVTITICSDSLISQKTADSDVFYSNKQTAKKIIKLAQENEIKVEREVYLQEEKKFNSEEIKHLEKNIFKIPYNIYNDEVKDIKLFLANNQYSEIENIAKEIIKLVRDESYTYKEISIIAQNIDTYSNLCKAIFNKYKIPLYVDTKKELSNNILVKYILAVLDIFSNNWKNESVFNYIKTEFSDIETEDIYLLERYATKWNIKGNRWYKEDWNFHDEDDIGEENIARINMARKKIVEPLIKFKEELTGTKTATQISNNIYKFLIENAIPQKLQNKIDKLVETGELNIAEEYETSWKLIMQLLDEIVMIFGDENITFENYMQILKIGFGDATLGTLPMLQDQVVVGDVSRSRSDRVRATFIIGLNDGNFPAVHKAEGFLDDSDREYVGKLGIELAKGTLENIYEDNFNIYKAFTIPSEKLFLSYASSDSEGGALRSSIMLSKIKKIFPKIIETSDIIEKSEEIINKASTFDILLDKLREYKENNIIESKWLEILNIYRNDNEWKVKLENALEALDYKNSPEKLTQANIDKLYGEKLKTSVSRLEKYKQCPYSYFIEYGLKLNDKETAKVEAVDTGSFMHDVIDTFFSEINDRNIEIKNITEKETEKIVIEIINEKLKLNRNYIFSVTPKYLNLMNRLKKVVNISIKYIVKSIQQSSFEVLGHEVEFGDNSKYKPIIISTESGKTVEIIGKIDRIDIAKNADGTYVRIIDYKSSMKDIELNKVVAGLQLQLITYLTETCKAEDFLPAGALYFNLIEPTIKTRKNLSDDEIEKEIKKQFKMNGLILADVDVIKMMDNKIEETGTSTIIPATIKKDGEISSKTKALTKEQFENLQKYTTKIIKEISDEIISGKINLAPTYNIKAQKGKTPCEYCNYKTICRFDINNVGNSYNYVDTMSRDEILEKIKNEN